MATNTMYFCLDYIIIGNIMTDGCGWISLNLAKQIPHVVGGALTKNEDNQEFIPLVTQCRLGFEQGFVKGTLATHPYLPNGKLSKPKAVFVF